ncbi:fimbria/pilus outer membrane usher protein, partial [Vibrio sp. V27_P1S3P104]
DNERCSVVQESTFELNKAKLTLSLLVPQAYMVSKPRGYISPAQWNFGHPAFFSNYDANYFQAKSLSSSNTGNSSSLFVGLRAGGNLGSWRLRSQFNYSYSDIGSQNQNQWNHIRSYAQTALPNWKSDLTVGQTYTADTVFDSIGFTGAEIKSDIRMKPASQRGYAPVIAGVANSVATVTVSQQGRKIYQTTVSPGPFEIRDLYSTYYQGDLDVSMQEANGKVTTFTVPFNAVSGSVRPGQVNYSVSLGRLRLAGIDGPYFAQGVYERGITNNLTTNTGVRISDDYLGAAVGVVLGTPVGAIGLRSIFSNATVHGTSYQGWRAGADYSIGFNTTGTTITLAGYRYSTVGYRTLNDVAGANTQVDSSQWMGFTQSERALLSLNINQSLANMGQLYFSGSHTSYRDGKDAITQAQLGYSSQIGIATLNVNYSKVYQEDKIASDDVISVGISLPLGERRYPTLASLSATHDKSSTSYQAGLSGQLSGLENTTYGLSYSLDKEVSSYSMNINRVSTKAAFGASYSRSDHYKQWGANIRGGVVIHQGGINFSQSLGDSFAVVKADMAEGTRIRNTFGASIDSNGYGVVSHLSPYTVNQISLDPSTTSNTDVELAETQFKLIPTAGAILQYDVPTTVGKAILIQIVGETLPPLGAEIKDSQGKSIGMVSQMGLAFLRVSEFSGKLSVRWGERENQQCYIRYDISNKMKNSQELLRVASVCQ